MKGWHGGQSAFVNNLFSPMKRLYAPLDVISGAATTDKDGRFTLHGAGGERIVQVTISGSGVARTTPFVITRPGFNAEPYNAVLRKDETIRRFVVANRFLGLHSPAFSIVAEAGKTIEGVVKDADTGKPLAGCRVRANNGFQTRFSAIANAEGKYRLEGMAKGTNGYSLIAMPPTGSVHLPRRVQAADTVGLPKVRLDIDLMKGGIVTGRVVDKQTGKGVRCYFASYPLPDNKFIGSKPGFDSRDVLLQRVAEYDEDGRFRLVALPGKSLLTARVMETEKMNGLRLNVYRQALPDPEHKDIFTAAGDSWRVAAAGNYLVILNDENAVKVIDVKENSETRVELSVERGATARIQVQDADGKPLAGAWAAGLSDLRLNTTFKLPGATATVCALNPDKPRAMAFFHAGKKLSGTAMISGGEKEPVIVKLAPVGKVTGRLLDADGNPRKGVEVSILPRTDLGRDLFRFAELIGNPVRTDNDGRFRIEDVVPGLKFTLTLRQGRAFFVGEPPISVKQVKPGETLDLGNIRIKPMGRFGNLVVTRRGARIPPSHLPRI